MEEISVIGIDLAKRVFQLCAMSPDGTVIWEKRLKRRAFVGFLEEAAPRCLIGMEACGGSQYWARWLTERGFAVKLMAPRTVKAYREGVHKNDRRDARAAAEAASRRSVAAVRVKSPTAQATQAVMRVRERRIRQLGQTTNQLRGLLNEFGIIAPKGTTRLLARVDEFAKTAAFRALPASMQEVAQALHGEIIDQAAKVKAATRAMMEAALADESCRLLRTIPNLGPITSAALTVALEVPEAFRNGRAFAAFLRLVPRQHDTADHSMQLGIGGLESCELRRYLVLAAQSLLTRVGRLTDIPEDPLLAWAQRKLREKNRNVAAVAVAAKLARLAWAVMAHNRPYAPRAARNPGDAVVLSIDGVGGRAAVPA
jgi:transposase